MMGTKPIGTQTRAGLLAFAVASVSVWGISSAASSEDESEIACDSPIVETVVIEDGDRSQTLYRAGMPGEHSRTYDIEPLVAGTYTATGVSWDEFESRAEAPAQPDERWYAELLAADDTVLATTGDSEDLPDEVAMATWVGELGELSWEGPDATKVRFVHVDTEDMTPNSVTPVCLGMEALVEIEQVTTTLPPTTSTTLAPSTTTTELIVLSTTTIVEPEVVRPEFTG